MYGGVHLTMLNCDSEATFFCMQNTITTQVLLLITLCFVSHCIHIVAWWHSVKSPAKCCTCLAAVAKKILHMRSEIPF